MLCPATLSRHSALHKGIQSRHNRCCAPYDLPTGRHRFVVSPASFSVAYEVQIWFACVGQKIEYSHFSVHFQPTFKYLNALTCLQCVTVPAKSCGFLEITVKYAENYSNALEKHFYFSIKLKIIHQIRFRFVRRMKHFNFNYHCHSAHRKQILARFR